MQARRLSSRELAIALGLASLMAATRSHPFGSLLQLPDASLAVFFLGGLALGRAALFGAFLAEAALVDYLAIAYGGTSGWCVTPAYAILAPAYGCLWAGGVWCAGRPRERWREWVRLAAALAAGTALWFVISNAGFYAFSGYFGELSAAEYAVRVAKYFPPYLASTAAYVAAALAAATLADRLAARPARPAAP